MNARKGYTLLELMLVLALIVVAAGITFSLSDVLLNSNKVTAAQDQIRGALVKLRSRAMAEGRAYTFQVMENSGQYKIAPDLDSELTADSEDSPFQQEAQLPEGAMFVKQKESLFGKTTRVGGASNYETAVVFYPDGTASQDAIIIFGVQGQSARAIRIRGLTGSIQQMDLTGKEAQP